MMKLQVTLKKSLIGRRPNQVKTAYALGLRKINQVVVKEDNEAIRGMIKTIHHLVSVQEVE
ncbi:MAG: 50S ribosomal protein L30 [Acholeplasmataceae bacterium]|nr:MAG: 50S ribosomal protein L30 [Acholeplasmataceae bacterium]